MSETATRKKTKEPQRKASIYFATPLFVKAKKRAIDEGITFTALMNRALRNEITRVVAQ